MRAYSLLDNTKRQTLFSMLAFLSSPQSTIGNMNVQQSKELEYPEITQNLYTHNTRKMQEDAVTVFVKSLQTKD